MKEQLQMGMPIVLIDAKGLGMYDIEDGQTGMVNSVFVLPEGEIIYFMPDNQMRFYAIKADRVVIDEDKIEAWREANAED